MCIYTYICAICIFILVSFPRFCWEGLRAARASRLIIDCAVLGRHKGELNLYMKAYLLFFYAALCICRQTGGKMENCKRKKHIGLSLLVKFWLQFDGLSLAIPGSLAGHLRTLHTGTRCSAAGVFSLQILHYIFSGQKLTRENRKQTRANTTGICIYYLVNVALKCIEDRSI